jgi:hypothetical protein
MQKAVLEEKAKDMQEDMEMQAMFDKQEREKQ